ncbi:uncharacterized protein [Miscanthus floridulus]|uniref:uncharacterized protein n=1 Tax=Miscanthus floridulus TaxID=154761 RepID=UPI003459C262
MAKRAWLVLSGTPARTPASILGVLCRKWYPGIVQLSKEPVVREPASNWDRYALVTDDTYRNKQERVLAEFWKYFKAEEGLEAQADRVAAVACRKYVTEMHHHGRVQAHIDYYR